MADTLKARGTQPSRPNAMRARLPKRLTAGLAALCAVLVLNAAVSYYNISRLVEAEQWVSHTLEVRQTLANLLAAIVTSETAQRGFTITGDTAFLEQHHAAVAEARAAQETVRTLTRDNPSQQRRVDVLDSGVAQKLSWTEHVIRIWQERGVDAALAAIASGQGAALMERVRAAVKDMDDEEDILLRARNVESSRSLRATILTFAVFAAASVLLALLVFQAMRRDLLNRQAAEKRLFERNQMLRAVLDNIPQRVFWKDRESRFLGSNHLFARDLGYIQPDQIVGKTDHDTMAAANADAYRAEDLAVIESGVAKLNYKERIRRSDGGIGWAETSKVPLRDPQGGVIGLLGTYQDITDRVRYQEELEHRAKFDSLTGLPTAHFWRTASVKRSPMPNA